MLTFSRLRKNMAVAEGPQVATQSQESDTTATTAALPEHPDPPPAPQKLSTNPEDTTQTVGDTTANPNQTLAETDCGSHLGDSSTSSHAATSVGDASRSVPSDTQDRIFEQIGMLTEQVSSILTLLTATAEQVAELTRLRARDSDLIDRLHADNIALRRGELVAATNPMIVGMIELHDQMEKLAAADPAGDARLLDSQLLQTLEFAGVHPLLVEVGQPFEAACHAGAGRVPTSDPAADGTIARIVRKGFARTDGTVIRTAEVEVNRMMG